MHRRAFTLIEVLVVLAVLALVAILSFNFFGNAMQEARLKSELMRFDQIFRNLEYAMDTHENKTGSLMPTDSLSTGTLQNFVAWGYLTEVPKTTPKGWEQSGYSPAAYRWKLDYIHFGGPSTAKEDMFMIPGIKKALCEEINNFYTSGGRMFPATYTDLRPYAPFQAGCNYVSDAYGTAWWVVRWH